MSAAQSRTVRLLFALAGHTRDGLRLSQIAELVGESSPTTLKDLQQLRDDGCAEQLPDKTERWRLSPRVVRIAIAHHEEVRREEQRLSDWRSRYEHQS